MFIFTSDESLCLLPCVTTFLPDCMVALPTFLRIERHTIFLNLLRFWLPQKSGDAKFKKFLSGKIAG